jgi:catechol 2,3-dioxygenase-like lactoylglutathione lyase family enzyme
MPPSTPAATIVSLDHLVLTVKSIPASKDWYTQYLGMRHEVFVSGGAERHALIFGNSKINLHEAGKVSLSASYETFHYLLYSVFPGIFNLTTFTCKQEFEPKAGSVQPGSADLCFVTEDDVSEVRERLVKAGVEMVDLGGAAADDGTVMRTGARGKLRSVYCRDPDGNLIE